MFLRPGVEFKAVERDTLHADGDIRELGTYISVESILVHPQIPRRITQPDKSRHNGKRRRMQGAVRVETAVFHGSSLPTERAWRTETPIFAQMA
jgi:hypothetical protein